MAFAEQWAPLDLRWNAQVRYTIVMLPCSTLEEAPSSHVFRTRACWQSQLTVAKAFFKYFKLPSNMQLAPLCTVPKRLQMLHVIRFHHAGPWQLCQVPCFRDH